MTEYCRLCAELKESDEIVALISDVEQSMEQKLRACCQWTAENTELRLPHGVCSICLNKLEKCWLFSQSVQLAQQRLFEIFENGKEPDTKPLAAELVQTVYNSVECSNNQQSFHSQGTQKLEYKCDICAQEFFTITELNTHRQQDCNGSNEIDSIFVDCKPTTASDFNESESDMDTGANQVDDYDDDSNVIDEQPTISKRSTTQRKEKKPVIKSKLTQNEKKGKKLKKQSNGQRETKKQFACDKCDRVYRDRSGLSHHRHVHTGERPHKCSLCDSSFRKKSYLSYHLIAHVNRSSGELKIEESTDRVRIIQANGGDPIDVGQNIFKCDKCNRIYGQNSELKVHRLKHFNDRIFECWLCHKTIKRWISMKKHLKYHVNRVERNWICDSCGKAFLSNRDLLNHIRVVHCDERPYKCKICGLGFKLTGLLTKHLKTHDESQFKCDQCGKSFRSEQSLNYHLESHTGTFSKPFVCDFCGNGFRMNRHLQDHRRIHTGEKPYTCDLCPSSFRARNQFSTHMQKAHGISLLARKRQKLSE